jgi:hypothetical protein
MGKITQTQIEKFFSILEQTGNITTACLGAGISRNTIYLYMENTDFKQRVDNAKETAVEHLEGYALERAKNGSDVLVMFLLKSLKPEKYRDNPKIIQNNMPTNFIIDLALPDDTYTEHTHSNA